MNKMKMLFMNVFLLMTCELYYLRILCQTIPIKNESAEPETKIKKIAGFNRRNSKNDIIWNTGQKKRYYTASSEVREKSQSVNRKDEVEKENEIFKRK